MVLLECSRTFLSLQCTSNGASIFNLIKMETFKIDFFTLQKKEVYSISHIFDDLGDAKTYAEDFIINNPEFVHFEIYARTF